jgi:hypothetical protein
MPRTAAAAEVLRSPASGANALNFTVRVLQAGSPACTTCERMLRRAKLHDDGGRECEA